MDLEMPRRLDKFLADARVGSRTQIIALARRGVIHVNGAFRLANKLVDPQGDVVEVEGVRATLSPPRVYALLNKPAGWLTAMSDVTDRRCVASLFPPEWGGRVAPCGRLDKPTTGALLCTDDGDLNQLLTLPEFHVWKRYVLTVLGEVVDSDPRLAQMREGVVLNGTRTRPSRCGVVEGSTRPGQTAPLTDVWLEICEGRNRQVRRMAGHVRLKVIHLHREAIGPLHLRGVEPGEWRMLDGDEVDALYDAAGGRQAPIEGARRAMRRRIEAGELDEVEVALVRRYLETCAR